MENEDIYFEKYQKYKAKYLELKELEQSGGMSFFGKIKSVVGQSPLDSYNNSLRAANNKKKTNIDDLIRHKIPKQFDEWFKSQQGKTFEKIKNNCKYEDIVGEVNQYITYENFKDIFLEDNINNEYSKYMEAHELYIKFKFTEFKQSTSETTSETTIEDTLKSSDKKDQIAHDIRIERESVGDMSQFKLDTNKILGIKQRIPANVKIDGKSISDLENSIAKNNLNIPLSEKLGFGDKSIFADVIQGKIISIYNNIYQTLDIKESTLLANVIKVFENKLQEPKFKQNKMTSGLLLNVALILTLRKQILQAIYYNDGNNPLGIFDSDGLIHGISVDGEKLQTYTQTHERNSVHDIQENLTNMGSFHTISIDKSMGLNQNVTKFSNFKNSIESISNIKFNLSEMFNTDSPLTRVVTNYSDCLQLICDLTNL